MVTTLSRFRKGAGASMLETLPTDIPFLNPRSFAEGNLRLMRETGALAVAVADGSGPPVGLVTHAVTGELVMIRTACLQAFDVRRWRRTQSMRV